MTSKEKESIDRLEKIVLELKRENQEFKDIIKKESDKVKDKVDKKLAPIHLESDILQCVQSSMDKAISDTLTGYNSPLSKIISIVIDEHSSALREIISDSFNEVIKKEEFKTSIVSAFSHKVSRSVISNNNGLFDKVLNDLKGDSIFKSKMALAVSSVVEEVLKDRKNG